MVFASHKLISGILSDKWTVENNFTTNAPNSSEM